MVVLFSAVSPLEYGYAYILQVDDEQTNIDRFDLIQEQRTSRTIYTRPLNVPPGVKHAELRQGMQSSTRIPGLVRTFLQVSAGAKL